MIRKIGYMVYHAAAEAKQRPIVEASVQPLLAAFQAVEREKDEKARTTTQGYVFEKSPACGRWNHGILYYETHQEKVFIEIIPPP